jgi:uncharacterized protein (TIGR03083 family)
MTASLRLPSRDYLAFLDSESARFTDLLTHADPAGTVPSCPDWSAADLLWHLTEVQWFWGSIVGRGLHDPADARVRQAATSGGYERLLGLQLEATERLLTALGAGDDGDPVWTWLDDDQTRGFVRRRQAHEVLIHRLDAEQLVGEVTPLDENLAADGVDEALRIMFGGTPAGPSSTGRPGRWPCCASTRGRAGPRRSAGSSARAPTAARRSTSRPWRCTTAERPTR